MCTPICVCTRVWVAVFWLVPWWGCSRAFSGRLRPSPAVSGCPQPSPALRVRAALPLQTPPLRERFSHRHWHFHKILSPALSLPISSRFFHCYLHSLSLSPLGILVYGRIGACTWLHADARKCIGACTGVRMCALQCILCLVVGRWLGRDAFGPSPAVSGRLQPSPAVCSLKGARGSPPSDSPT